MIKSQLQPLIPKGMSPSPLGNFRNIHYQDSAAMSGIGPVSQMRNSLEPGSCRSKMSTQKSVRSGSIKRPVPQHDCLLNAMRMRSAEEAGSKCKPFNQERKNRVADIHEKLRRLVG